MTGIQISPTALVAGVAESALAAGYLFAVWRTAASRGVSRRHPWSPLTAAFFVAGVISVWVATGSRLAALADHDETLHMIQHVLLMMVAAPLVVAGRPITLLCRVSPRPVQVGIVRVLRSSALSRLTSPWITWPLYVIGMFVYWLSRPVYQASLTHPALHDATHLAFFTIALLYWEPLLGDGSSRRLLPHPVRILAVLLTMPFELLLGVGMTLLPYPLDPGASLAANHAAGQIFWIVAMLCSGLAIGAMSYDWLARDERAARNSTSSAASIRGLSSSPSSTARSSPTPA